MNTKLITALRVAAHVLEDGSFPYTWEARAQCNCGVLFCALKGVSPQQLASLSGGLDKGTWSRLLGLRCPVSGVPTDALLVELQSYGLSLASIVALEWLNDPAVLARLPRPWWRRLLRRPVRLHYSNKAHAIAYMRAWADLLVEQGLQDRALGSVQGQTQHDHEHDRQHSPS